MCPVIKELRKNGGIDLKLLSTGQHKDMLEDVLKIENIKADYDFSLMKVGQTLSYLTAEILHRTEKIIDELKPDLVLIHGDTTSSFAGALAAFYKRIPIAHIEAGLRTYDNGNPYPEELNRCAISRMAKFHFAPTEQNKINLIKEGIKETDVFVTGNTVIDVLKKNIENRRVCDILLGEEFIILTSHRRENLGEEMKSVFRVVKRISEELGMTVVYPIHKNEKILALAASVLSESKNIKIIPPLKVDVFHLILSKCRFVITDSGGIQEEASYLGKPLLITRKHTERKELLSYNGFKLVGSDEKVIFEESKKLIFDNEYYNKNAIPTKVFGDGNASVMIAKKLSQLLGF